MIFLHANMNMNLFYEFFMLFEYIHFAVEIGDEKRYIS